MGKGGDPKCKGRSSALLYPSVYKMIRLGALPCSYWADFGHFLPNTLPKRRKNLIDLTFTTPPKLGGFEGWCYFSRIEGQFPKMSCCCL